MRRPGYPRTPGIQVSPPEERVDRSGLERRRRPVPRRDTRLELDFDFSHAISPLLEALLREREMPWAEGPSVPGVVRGMPSAPFVARASADHGRTPRRSTALGGRVDSDCRQP